MSHHDELLALAGHVPDGWLAVAREVLADRDVDRLTRLRAALEPEPQGERTRYRFFPQVRGHEDADREVVGAITAKVGAQACWATMRSGADRVYLVQIDEHADPPAVADAAQRALSEVEKLPRVEVFSRDAVLPRYHEDALLAADLLWSYVPMPHITVASSFDGSGPYGPWFDPGRELLVDPAARRVLLDFLTSGEVVLTAKNRLPDVLTHKLDVVPADLLSDGAWVWSAATAYYLDRHQVAPDAALAAYAMANQPGGRLSPLARYNVRAALSSNGGVAA